MNRVRSGRDVQSIVLDSDPTPDAPLILNEAINSDLQCIFVAIPKTGTTSVRRQIRQAGHAWIVNPHLDILQIRDCLYPYLLIRSLGTNHSFPSTGVLSDQYLRQEAKKIFDSFFKFSSVRNPWARAVSLYARREGVVTGDQLSFEEFCENHLYASDTCLHPTLHRNQVDWLSDEEGRCLMDYVYKLEEFDRATRDIAEMTDGRVNLKPLRANVNLGSDAQGYRAYYGSRSKRIIAERFEKDIDTFGYTF